MESRRPGADADMKEYRIGPDEMASRMAEDKSLVNALAAEAEGFAAGINEFWWRDHDSQEDRERDHA